MAGNDALAATVGPDGSLVLSAAELDRVGVHAGDLVSVAPIRKPRVRSMLGYGLDPRGFTDEHLAEVRVEMGESVGEDLTA